MACWCLLKLSLRQATRFISSNEKHAVGIVPSPKNNKFQRYIIYFCDSTFNEVVSSSWKALQITEFTFLLRFYYPLASTKTRQLRVNGSCFIRCSRQLLLFHAFIAGKSSEYAALEETCMGNWRLRETHVFRRSFLLGLGESVRFCYGYTFVEIPNYG